MKNHIENSLIQSQKNRKLHFFLRILINFFRISRQTPEKSDVCHFSIKFAKANSKIAEILEICENSKLFNIIQFYSMVYLGAPRGTNGWAGKYPLRLRLG